MSSTFKWQRIYSFSPFIKSKICLQSIEAATDASECKHSEQVVIVVMIMVIVIITIRYYYTHYYGIIKKRLTLLF